MRRLIAAALVLICSIGARADALSDAADSLRAYVDTLDARVGVVVMADNGGLWVGSQQAAPMASVMKFPVALAVAQRLHETGGTTADSVTVGADRLHTDTYSPMLALYPAGRGHRIALRDLLDFALRLSDNNACDILIDYAGGVDAVQACLDAAGRMDTHVRRTEADMHADVMLSYDNTSTPFSMARMMRDFDWHAADDAIIREIKSIMESCETGTNRLVKPLTDDGALIGHKTGTGDVNPSTGRIIAVNDAGYVHTPEGLHYAIAVFVTDSGYSLPETEAIIARISETVYRAIRAKGRP